jgi:required for meiotic nuclear division protein 1
MCIGERIDLSRFRSADRLGLNPYLIALADDCVATLSRYGVVVFFNASSEHEDALLQEIAALVSQPNSRRESETLVMRVSPDEEERLENSVVVVRELTVERLQLIGWVLSRSVVLGEYESRVFKDFDRVEPFAVELQTRGVGGRKMSELLQHVGSSLLTELKLVGRVEVREKPELLWEHPELDTFFLRLQTEFELNDRFAALERKLDLISRTVGTVLTLLQNRRSLRVEWYIVALIVLEFMLSLYQLQPQ